MYVVEGAEQMAVLGRLGVVPAVLRVRLRREHVNPLPLHVLDLGLLVLLASNWELEEGKAPFLGPCALGRWSVSKPADLG